MEWRQSWFQPPKIIESEAASWQGYKQQSLCDMNDSTRGKFIECGKTINAACYVSDLNEVR